MAIFYLCPDIAFPVGGVRVIYRHVEVLRRHGIEAFVLHARNNFRCRWFENNVPIAYGGKVVAFAERSDLKWPIVRSLQVLLPRRVRAYTICEKDFLVFPEIYGNQICAFQCPAKKVIVNLSGFFTFWNHASSLADSRTPYRDTELAAVIVTSKWPRTYLRYAFPGLKVHEVPVSIDTSKYRPRLQKKRQISLFIRKRPDDAFQVLNLLKMRGTLADFRIVVIEKMTDAQVIHTLQDSAIFLSFGENEGFGLPAAEAMACGCVVVGYHGIGGREFFRKQFSFPIQTGDIVKFTQQVEKLIADFRSRPLHLITKGRKAADYVRLHFSRTHEERSLLHVWHQLLGRKGISTVPSE